MLVDLNPLLRGGRFCWSNATPTTASTTTTISSTLARWGGNLCVLSLADGRCAIGPAAGGRGLRPLRPFVRCPAIVFGYRRPSPKATALRDRRRWQRPAAGHSPPADEAGGSPPTADLLRGRLLRPAGLSSGPTTSIPASCPTAASVSPPPAASMACSVRRHYLACTNLFRMDADGAACGRSRRRAERVHAHALGRRPDPLQPLGVRVQGHRGHAAAVDHAARRRPARSSTATTSPIPACSGRPARCPASRGWSCASAAGTSRWAWAGAAARPAQGQADARTDDAHARHEVQNLRGLFPAAQRRVARDVTARSTGPLSALRQVLPGRLQPRPRQRPPAYGIHLLDVFGNRVPIYRDPAISWWQPMLLRPRPGRPCCRPCRPGAG